MTVTQILLWILFSLFAIFTVALLVALFVPLCFKMRLKYDRCGGLIYEGLFYILHPIFYRYKFNQDDFSDYDDSDDVVNNVKNVNRSLDKDDVKSDNVATEKASSDNVAIDNVINDHIAKNYGDENVVDNREDKSNIDVVDVIDVVNDVDVDDIDNNDDTDKKEEARLDAMYNTSSDKKTGEEKISIINKIKRNKLYRIWADKPVRQKIFRWFLKSPKHFIKLVRVKKLHASLTLGLEDPAKLGKSYGYYVAAKSVLPRTKNVEVEFTPIFCEKQFEIESDIFIKTSVARVLYRLTIIIALFPIFKLRKIWKSRASAE